MCIVPYASAATPHGHECFPQARLPKTRLSVIPQKLMLHHQIMDDNHEKYYCLDVIADLKPVSVLDVGCGCGEMTVRLAALCERVTAVDLFDGLIQRCRRENPRPNVEYMQMDARELKFPDRNFALVLENNSLHHMEHWEKALDEMVRVAQSYVLVEEPIANLRNDAKQTAAVVQDLVLEAQKEVGYPHYRHLRLDDLLAGFRNHDLNVSYEVFATDEPSTWDGYETHLRFFAEKSRRPAYWLDRFANLKEELAGRPLQQADKVLVVATRKT